MYQRARAEAVGKARKSQYDALEIADIVALKYYLSEKQRLRLREELWRIRMSTSQAR